MLMTTYRSNGHVVATGELFLEVRTEAAEQDELLEELWDALASELRVAVAVFEPRRPADAAMRHEASAWGRSLVARSELGFKVCDAASWRRRLERAALSHSSRPCLFGCLIS
ncbi:hypothetical protein GCM10010207_61370 [Streptomyces atratus]|nr:hypothetical protein GCM10010207_61370 [Streptomyces atratus]